MIGHLRSMTADAYFGNGILPELSIPVATIFQLGGR